jgi:predicted AAA+ superfamily ATPase
MWIIRDFIQNFDPMNGLEALIIRGPRQIGKSSLLLKLNPPVKDQIYLDDSAIRNSANIDPEFILQNCKLPVLIDEVQLAPPIFFSIKKNIDALRRERLLNNSTHEMNLYRMTGSDQTLLDEQVKETLAGRIQSYYLYGLSVNEINKHDPNVQIKEIIFRGGFPELWIRKELNPVRYISDYISTFVEKDIAQTAGVEKLKSFMNTLQLLAARTGELLNYESLGADSGVAGKTIKEWVGLLEKNKILYVLKPYHSNLNKRLIKMSKIYFCEVGICTRLQSHQEMDTILHSPQAGHLFENLVLTEILKTEANFFKIWNLYFWRTKEKEEIDFIIEDNHTIILIEAKLSSANQTSIKIPEAISASGKKIISVIVCSVGESIHASKNNYIIPIKNLAEFLIRTHLKT